MHKVLYRGRKCNNVYWIFINTICIYTIKESILHLNWCLLLNPSRPKCTTIVRYTKYKYQFHKFDADVDIVLGWGWGVVHCTLYLSFFNWLKLAQFVDIKIYIVIYFLLVILVISLLNILTLYKLTINKLISLTSVLALTTKITTPPK